MILPDEQLYHWRLCPLLNEHFDVKHIRDDLHLSGLPDPKVYELALSQGPIILTKNVKDFRPLIREDSPGIVGIPETWSTAHLDTALAALFMRRAKLLPWTFPSFGSTGHLKSGRVDFLAYYTDLHFSKLANSHVF